MEAEPAGADVGGDVGADVGVGAGVSSGTEPFGVPAAALADELAVPWISAGEVGVAATVGRGVSWSSATVWDVVPRGRITTLSLVQTAARLASGAITADTGESLLTDPRVWPVPLATVQLLSAAEH